MRTPPKRPEPGRDAPEGWDREFYDYVMSLRLSGDKRFLLINHDEGGTTIKLKLDALLEEIAGAVNSGGSLVHNLNDFDFLFTVDPLSNCFGPGGGGEKLILGPLDGTYRFTHLAGSTTKWAQDVIDSGFPACYWGGNNPSLWTNKGDALLPRAASPYRTEAESEAATEQQYVDVSFSDENFEIWCTDTNCSDNRGTIVYGAKKIT